MKKLKVEVFTPNNQPVVGSCYLGISLANPYLDNTKKLSSILNWINANYESCNILIGDYLYRINEYIFWGKSEHDAIEKSLFIGQILHDHIVKNLPATFARKFSITHWIDILKKFPEYEDEQSKLRHYFNNNACFKESIESVSTLFVKKQIANRFVYATEKEAILKSNEYLLEEMAVFAIYAKNGYNIHLYPGEILKTLKEITDGKYPDLTTPLSNVKYIQFKI